MIDILHVISFFFSKKYFTYTSRVDRLDRQSTRDPYVHGTLLPSFTNLFLIPVTRFHLPSYPSSSCIEPSPVPFHWPLPRTRLLFDILLYSSSTSYSIPLHPSLYLTPSPLILYIISPFEHPTSPHPSSSIIVPLPIPFHRSSYLYLSLFIGHCTLPHLPSSCPLPLFLNILAHLISTLLS